MFRRAAYYVYQVMLCVGVCVCVGVRVFSLGSVVCGCTYMFVCVALYERFLYGPCALTVLPLCVACVIIGTGRSGTTSECMLLHFVFLVRGCVVQYGRGLVWPVRVYRPALACCMCNN